MNIGTNIKKLRELKGFSRQHVADTIGVSLKTYGNIENELTSPDVKTLESIAEAIEVSIYKLFNFDEKVILNNHGKHVENFGNSFNQYGMSEEQRELFEKLILEKDLRLKQYEEIILAKEELLKIYKSKKD
jgi:transcriptional regulator with XRE-family HTH domain